MSRTKVLSKDMGTIEWELSIQTVSDCLEEIITASTTIKDNKNNNEAHPKL
jgi:hypothetical protein